MKNIFYLLLVLQINCAAEKEQDEFKYVPFSKSVIHLTVNHPLPDTIKVHADAITIIPRGRSISNMLPIKDTGNYHLLIDIDRPVKTNLYIENDEYNILLFPNDTTHIELSSNQTVLNFNYHGRGKSINEYFIQKKNILGYTDILSKFQKTIKSNSTYNSIKNSIDSMTDMELSFLHKYNSSNFLPEWFSTYETAEIVYSGAGFKLTRPSSNERRERFKDTLPDDFFNFIVEIEIDNPDAIFSSVYFLFLEWYFKKDLPMDDIRKMPQLLGLKEYNSFIIEKSNNQLSGISKEVFHKRFFSAVASYYSSKSEIDSLANALQLTDYNDLILVNKGDIIKDFKLRNEFDSIVSFCEFKDQILYINFWATWCGNCIKNIPELNSLISKYEDDLRIEFVNVCLDGEKDRWVSVIKKHNLLGINLIAEGNLSTQLKRYFSIQGAPQYVLIGKNNILIEKNTMKAPGVNSKIEKLLEKISTTH